MLKRRKIALASLIVLMGCSLLLEEYEEEDEREKRKRSCRSVVENKKKSISNRKRAATNIHETLSSSEAEEAANIPPPAKKRGRPPKKKSKRPTKSKQSKKIPKEFVDVLAENELNLLENAVDEEDPFADQEPKIKTENSNRSKRLREELDDDISSFEETVPEFKMDISEPQISEAVVRRPRGRKSAARKPSTGEGEARNTPKRVTRFKAESSEEFVSDEQDEGEQPFTRIHTSHL